MRAAVQSHRAAALLVVAIVLAACRGGSTPTEPTPTTPPPGRTVEGGTLRVGLIGPVPADPATASLGSPSALMVLDLLHDGLTRLDPTGAAKPALATEWSADPTQTAWTFRLDPKATFTSGRAVTAADVVASLERVAKGGDGSLAALQLESIAGFRGFVSGAAAHLTGLAATDATTVTISLDRPLSVLPVVLASPQLGVVDVASLDAAVADAGALGDLDLSGGWAVDSAVDRVLTLARRPGAAGHVAEVELRSYAAANAAYDALDAGKVDWALVPPARQHAVERDHHIAAGAPFHAELFFGMRVKQPALANLELRRAITAAIDPDAIVERAYPGLATALAAVVPKGVAGHAPARCIACGPDPERARAVLAKAYPDGQVPSVAIDFDASLAQEEMATLVAEDLAEVGIPTQLRPKPLAEYKAFLVSGAQELFSFGWIGGYGSADAYLAPLFGSASDDNLTGYASPSVDAALAAARAAADPAAAGAQWVAVERQVFADAVIVPIAQFRIQAVVAPRVEGFQHAVDGSVDWAAVWLSDGA
ncbi:MAG: ABC transporter substrate-binding protein [Microthrixaceae bacterium]